MREKSVNIAMWSGPRNISTAMMYSFGNRPDCLAWDEPFYAFSLASAAMIIRCATKSSPPGSTDFEALVATVPRTAARRASRFSIRST